MGMTTDLFLHIGVHNAWSDGYARDIGLFGRQGQTKVVNSGLRRTIGTPSGIRSDRGSRRGENDAALRFTKSRKCGFNLEVVRRNQLDEGNTDKSHCAKEVDIKGRSPFFRGGVRDSLHGREDSMVDYQTIYLGEGLHGKLHDLGSYL
jgi:hypothetical protein